jgi:hypothetical protein
MSVKSSAKSSAKTDREGVFLTFDELLAVFPRLKGLEAVLEKDERAVLLKLEKVLYECLSIGEIEQRLNDFKKAENQAAIRTAEWESR